MTEQVQPWEVIHDRSPETQTFLSQWASRPLARREMDQQAHIWRQGLWCTATRRDGGYDLVREGHRAGRLIVRPARRA